RLRSGTAWRDDPTRSGVVIAAGIADSLHLDTGDTLTLHTGGKVATFEIIGVAEYLFDTVWMRWEELAQLAGLTKGAPVPNRYFTLTQVNGTPTATIGFDENARLGLIPADGQFFTPGEPGIIISAALAEQRGYAVGNTLELISGENRLTAPITGIFTISPQLAQPDQPGEWIGLYWEDLARLEGLPLQGEPIPGGLQIILPITRPTAKQVAAKIDEINEVLIADGINANYTNWTSSTEGVLQMIETARLVLNIAAAMIAAVGGIGLLSALSMSVFERQKEIGVMRSVGATSHTIIYQFLVEGVIVGVVAWLLGIPFSYALHHSLITQFNFARAPEARYPLIALVLGLVSTLVIAAFASLWPSWAAARKTVSDILRYQ
ncbi:MAG: ABC transporter permease, partial [Chloroflexi bacterium]|nr:ABC transporter permease [Chloroflexota bacterium]